MSIKKRPSIKLPISNKFKLRNKTFAWICRVRNVIKLSWERQRAAFFDIGVCHTNADSYRGLSLKQIYRIHENEKKRKYNSRVTEIEQGTFTPLVFTTTGGMADECLRYHSRLAELLSAKKQESYATTISWVRAKVSFAILRSALLFLRGSRTPKKEELRC